MINYPDKIFRKEELSRFLTKSILFIKPQKNYGWIWAFSTALVSISITSLTILLFLGASSVDDFLLLLSMFSSFILLTHLSLFNITVYLFKKSKKYGTFLKNIKIDTYTQLSSLLSFSNKYDTKKIKKALDNYDFQSPHLSSFINDNFSFTQKDLLAISNKELTTLYDSLVKLNMIDELKKIKRITDMGSGAKLVEKKWIDKKINFKNEEIKNIESLLGGKINKSKESVLIKDKTMADKI